MDRSGEKRSRAKRGIMDPTSRSGENRSISARMSSGNYSILSRRLRCSAPAIGVAQLLFPARWTASVDRPIERGAGSRWLRLNIRCELGLSGSQFQAPTSNYEWQEIPRRQEEIAIEFAGRWILHIDADEIRRPPFPHSTFPMRLRWSSGTARTELTST